jgi:hypothetical protein
VRVRVVLSAAAGCALVAEVEKHPHELRPSRDEARDEAIVRSRNRAELAGIGHRRRDPDRDVSLGIQTRARMDP